MAGLCLVALVGCDGAEDDPAEQHFRDEVLPVLEARCAAGVCHGAQSSAAVEALPEEAWVLRVDADGAITDWRQAYRASKEKINAVEDPVFSTLLRKPLAPIWGGLPHSGGDNLTSPEDPGYAAISTWVSMETGGGEDPERPELDEREAFFAEQVQPHLIGRSCAVANCHGLEAFIPYRLDPGIADDDSQPRFSVEMVRHNYQQSLGFLSLDGDPSRSRLLAKAVPLSRGGITHRGGNDSFIGGPGDPAYEALLSWANLEREARASEVTGEVTGVVFVRGPLAPGSVFDPGQFVPGRDLFLLSEAGPDGRLSNLTEHLHGDPADVRDPDISPEGTHVVFAMRRTEAEAFQIWEMELDSGEARRLTDDPARLSSGAALANVQPVYGSDGQIYFTSNRHDVIAENADAADLDLYRIPREGGDIERLTYTPAPEIDPALFRVAPLEGYLVFGYRRSVDAREKTVGFSFPLDFHVDYHIYFGITSTTDLLHQFSELPDGQSAAIVADSANVWRGGQLALVDRNLGPDLDTDLDTSASQPSLPGYAPTLRVLDEQARPNGVSEAGVWRDPVALPDGSLLAAWAPGPVDLDDPQAPPEFRIVHLEMDHAPGGCSGLDCTPKIDRVDTWTQPDGVADFSPVPVRSWPTRSSPTRPTHEDSDFELDPEDPSLFSMIDIGVNDGIMQNLFPAGTKDFDERARYVRLVEALPQSSAAGMPASLGPHMPARILGEVDLHEDYSVYAEVPPGVAFRTQLLDEQRMSLGQQHNRWLFVWPGQHFSQSTSRELYDMRCGGCHGAASGRPSDVLGVTDTTTQASLTLARYENRNPRKPRPPVALDDATRLSVDFVEDVWPVLERRCADSACHGGDAAAGGLTLSDEPSGAFTVAYRSLLSADEDGARRFIDADTTSARRSYLLEVVTGQEMEAARALGDHPDVNLSDEELLTLVRWVEVGAPFELPEEAR